ncbi:hypothetical protein BCJMU51_2869 [Bacillus cereus]|uniref:Uncharacterized protein n=1 Tax=Bacillus cereus TaxID=1396 RepID=A0A150AUR6_BACCE|nr:hypothetical protein B7P25_15150 [Bacillus thuringiensis]KMP70977.1 hypothetical protein TU57_06125 [Bacillus cereus]KYZ69007.1 hypothetical protein A3782_00510 [Bacillus sp. GZT]OFE41748.1 hypothetical protein BGV83_15600 [Bacillus anthracis]RSC65630.1 hypothetical protein EGS86_28480 [Bacillus sp. (in: firmicutes)]
MLCITDIGDVEKYMCRYKHKETVNILCKQKTSYFFITVKDIGIYNGKQKVDESNDKNRNNVIK